MDVRNFFEGEQITVEQAQRLEDTGQGHVSTAASGGRPPGFRYRDVPEGPWIRWVSGPGNIWIERQESACFDCGKPWREHLRPIWIRPDKDHQCVNQPASGSLTWHGRRRWQ
jgi:hypothetical protein